MSNETVVTEMLDAYNERRFGDFAASYAPGAVITYPQSGERIVGRDNILAMVQAFPSPPRFSVTEVHSAGDLLVVEADVDYGEGPAWKGAFIYTLDRGMVVSESAHFGAPFEAADWRASYRET